MIVRFPRVNRWCKFFSITVKQKGDDIRSFKYTHKISSDSAHESQVCCRVGIMGNCIEVKRTYFTDVPRLAIKIHLSRTMDTESQQQYPTCPRE